MIPTPQDSPGLLWPYTSREGGRAFRRSQTKSKEKLGCWFQVLRWCSLHPPSPFPAWRTSFHLQRREGSLTGNASVPRARTWVAEDRLKDQSASLWSSTFPDMIVSSLRGLKKARDVLRRWKRNVSGNHPLSLSARNLASLFDLSPAHEWSQVSGSPGNNGDEWEWVSWEVSAPALLWVAVGRKVKTLFANAPFNGTAWRGTGSPGSRQLGHFLFVRYYIPGMGSTIFWLCSCPYVAIVYLSVYMTSFILQNLLGTQKKFLLC